MSDRKKTKNYFLWRGKFVALSRLILPLHLKSLKSLAPHELVHYSIFYLPFWMRRASQECQHQWRIWKCWQKSWLDQMCQARISWFHQPFWLIGLIEQFGEVGWDDNTVVGGWQNLFCTADGSCTILLVFCWILKALQVIFIKFLSLEQYLHRYIGRPSHGPTNEGVIRKS